MHLDYGDGNVHQGYLYNSGAVKLKPWHKNPIKFLTRYEFNSLLDLGCGSGAFISKIQGKLIHPVIKGLDLDKTAVNIAKRRGLNVEYGIIDEEKTNYDVISAFELIEHIDNLELLFNQIKKHLNKNGILIGTTPNNKRWSVKIGMRESFDYPPNHVNYFDKNNLENVLLNYFSSVKIYPAIKHLPFSMVRYVINDYMERKLGFNLNDVPLLKKNRYVLALYQYILITPIWILAYLFSFKNSPHLMFICKR